jgi:hypothetical protein
MGQRASHRTACCARITGGSSGTGATAGTLEKPDPEDGFATLTVAAGGAAGSGSALGGEGGLGGGSAADGPSAEATALLETCSGEVSDDLLEYERPAVPYRIDIWEGDAVCERGQKLASVTGDGNEPGTLDTLVLPEHDLGESWSGAWSIEVTSTTGADLTLRFRVPEKFILP